MTCFLNDPVERKITFVFMHLKECPKIRQFDEPCQIQGKITDPNILSLRLSTETVDKVFLEHGPRSLQPTRESIQLGHDV
jgi:hypothetical protein